MEHAENAYRQENGSYFTGKTSFDLSSTRAIEAVLKSIQGGKKRVYDEEQGINKPPEAPRVIKPKRPLTAYNFFFQSERAKLLGIEIPTANITPQIKKRRKHRKTHGKIGFTELSQRISKKWRMLDDESRSFFLQKQEDDRERYNKEMSTYNQQIKSMGRVIDTTTLHDSSTNAGAETSEGVQPLEIQQSANSGLSVLSPLPGGLAVDQSTFDRNSSASLLNYVCRQVGCGVSPTFAASVSRDQGKDYSNTSASLMKDDSAFARLIGVQGDVSSYPQHALETATSIEAYLAKINKPEKAQSLINPSISEPQVLDRTFEQNQRSGVQILTPLFLSNQCQDTESVTRSSNDFDVTSIQNKCSIDAPILNDEPSISQVMVGATVNPPSSENEMEGKKAPRNVVQPLYVRDGGEEDLTAFALAELNDSRVPTSQIEQKAAQRRNVLELLHGRDGQEVGWSLLNLANGTNSYTTVDRQLRNTSASVKRSDYPCFQQRKRDVVVDEGKHLRGSTMMLRRDSIENTEDARYADANANANANANAYHHVITPDHAGIIRANFPHGVIAAERVNTTRHEMETTAPRKRPIMGLKETHVAPKQAQQQPVLYAMTLVPIYPEQMSRTSDS